MNSAVSESTNLDSCVLDKGQADAKLRAMKYKTDIGKENEKNENFCQLKQKLENMISDNSLILDRTDTSPIA